MLYGFFVSIYICPVHMGMQCPRRQKRVLASLELELQMIVSHHMGAGNLMEVFWKSSQSS